MMDDEEREKLNILLEKALVEALNILNKYLLIIHEMPNIPNNAEFYWIEFFASLFVHNISIKPFLDENLNINKKKSLQFLNEIYKGAKRMQNAPINFKNMNDNNFNMH
jgi:hypothetical protein